MGPITKLLVALLSCAVSAGALAATKVKPAEAWRVGVERTKCIAMRNYSGQNKRTLVIRPQTGNQDYTVGYINTYLASIDGASQRSKDWLSSGAGAITIPGGPNIVADFVRTPSLTLEGPETGIAVSRNDFIQMASGSSLSISAEGSTITFGDTSLGDVLPSLEQCRRTLWTRFGLDAAAVLAATRTAKAVKPLGDLIGIEDYPIELQKKKQSGPVSALWSIDTSGKVSGCKIVAPSKYDELNNLTCKLITDRARYLPALDEKGRPVPAWDTTTVFWIVTTINGRIPTVRRRLLSDN